MRVATCLPPNSASFVRAAMTPIDDVHNAEGWNELCSILNCRLYDVAIVISDESTTADRIITLSKIRQQTVFVVYVPANQGAIATIVELSRRSLVTCICNRSLRSVLGKERSGSSVRRSGECPACCPHGSRYYRNHNVHANMGWHTKAAESE